MAQDKLGIIWKAMELADDAIAKAVASEPEQPPPEMLYHYTSFESLLAIVKSKTLRASLATDLNDATEIRHGLALAHDWLWTQVPKDSSGLLSFEGQLASALQAAQRSTSTSVLDAPFVICFCGSASKSGQWLNYGCSGAGVALGFDPDLAANLRKPATPSVPYQSDFRRNRLQYDLHRQRLLIEKVLESVLRYMAYADDLDDLFHEAATAITGMLQRLAVRMKHPCFAEEDEYRLVTFLDRQSNPARLAAIEFHQTGRRAAFETYCFEPHMLKQVILGHACPASEGAVALSLAQAGFQDTFVRRSEVPVRP